MSALGASMTHGSIALHPLSETHRAALKAACAEDLDIWHIYPRDFGPEGFDESFDTIRAAPDWQSFALFDGEALVGMSSYIAITPEDASLEIGATYIRPAWRGTAFNRTVKDLMIRRALGCGFRWIGFKVDARNQRSQAAVLKLGAEKTGVAHKDRTTWTGFVRDTVMFRLDAEKWSG